MRRKKDSKTKCKCRDCKFAYLMQSSKENPVIALCKRDTDGWRDARREVANLPKLCDMFEQRYTPEIINPMIEAE